MKKKIVMMTTFKTIPTTCYECKFRDFSYIGNDVGLLQCKLNEKYKHHDCDTIHEIKLKSCPLKEINIE